MASYQPLFSVSVGHRYFSDGVWKGLDFIPEPGTSRIIGGVNALVKNGANGIEVFYDADKLHTLRLYADEANGRARFSFGVFARDRSFWNYTVPSVRKDGAVLYFSNGGTGGDAAGATASLSKDGFVSEKDFVDIGTLAAGGVFCGSERRRPDFMVDIFSDPAADGGLAARDYVVNFNARQSYLKYHLLGAMNRNNLFIVDLDNQVEFESCGDHVLPGNRPCKVFRSKSPVPILEKPTVRFQLKEQGQGTGKVLIKRLPAASESRLGMELIDGRREIVAESFINC